MKKLLRFALLMWVILCSPTAFAVNYVVSSTGNSAATSGTLPWCVQQAVGTAGTHTITFSVTGTITLSGALNLYAQNITINGANGNQPGITLQYPGGTAIAITGGTQTIRGIIFQSMATGISINGGTGHLIAGCWFGINNAGTSKGGVAIDFDGINIKSSNVTIGGTSAADRNVISGCANTVAGQLHGGIMVDGSVSNIKILGNYIGTDVSGNGGAGSVGNGNGEYFYHHGIVITNGNSGSANSVVIDNNVISNNFSCGIRINWSQYVVITNNKIGTGANGAPLGNATSGIWAGGGSQNLTIGGTASGQANLISANGSPSVPHTPNTQDPKQWDWFNSCGVYFEDVNNSLVSGNFIGTDATGETTLNNTMGNLYAGVKIKGYGGSNNNTIQSNIVGGNGIRSYNSGNKLPGHGILLQGGNTTANNIYSNYVGISPKSANIRNQQDGISLLDGVHDNNIGAAGKGNFCSNNTFGIFIQNNCSKNKVYANFVGTNIAGTAAAPNLEGGIGIQDLSNGNIVGGVNAGEGNLVSGNTNAPGILVRNGGRPNPAHQNIIQNNIIGFDVSGTLPLPNKVGVYINGGSSGNIIGGTTAGTRNYIGYNTQAGIELSGSKATVVKNNYIGFDKNGSAAPNGTDGIYVHGGANGDLIGGIEPLGRNYIGNNINAGIELDTAQGAVIKNNYIGLKEGGAPASNGADGINIHGVSTSNIIGGIAGDGNFIGYNKGNGVGFSNPGAVTSTQNAINNNSIFCNAKRGIVLNGGNNGYATPTFGGTPAAVKVTGPAGSWIEVYKIDSCYKCPATGNTDQLQGKTLFAAGASPFTFTPAAGTTYKDYTATASSANPATTPVHNTSEFSSCQSLCSLANPSITGAPTTACQYAANTLSVTPPSGSSWASYQWNTGATSSTLSVTLSTPGTANYSVTVKDAEGCSYSANASITVSPAPGDPVLPNPSPAVCLPSTDIPFSVTNPQTGVVYTWTLPNGATIKSGTPTDGSSILVNFPSTITATSGTIKVSASIGTCKSLNDGTTGFTINKRPDDPLLTDPSPAVCLPSTQVKFGVNNPQIGAVYTWTLPAGASISSGTSATGSSIQVDFPSTITATSGKVTVSAVLNGCKNLLDGSTNFQINNRPANPLLANPSPDVCLPSTQVGFAVTNPQNGASYTWTLPSGAVITPGTSVSGSNITVDFPNTITATSGQVTVSASINGCKSLTDGTTNFNINKRPNDPLLANPSPDVCLPGAAITFSVSNPQNNATYTWTLPAGASITQGTVATGSSIKVDFPATLNSGQVQIAVSATLNGCKDLSDGSTNFSLIKNATTPLLADPAPDVCLPSTGVTFNVTNPQNGATYTWTLPAGASFTSGTATDKASVQVDFPASVTATTGTITVTSTVNGCKSLTDGTTSFSIKKRPDDPTLTDPSPSVCVPASAVGFSVTNPQNNAIYNWVLPSGVTVTPGTPSTGPSIQVDFAGSITATSGMITVSSSLDGCKDLKDGNTTFDLKKRADDPILPNPSPAVCLPGTAVQFSVSNPQAGASYTWTLPSGATITSGTPADGPSVQIDFSGTITATTGKITVSSMVNGCKDVTDGSTNFALNKRADNPLLPDPSPAVCLPSSGVTFNVTNPQAGASYTWNLPTGVSITPGTSPNGPSVQVDFSKSIATPTSVITVSAIINGCKDLTDGSTTMELKARPEDPVITGPASVCKPMENVPFSATLVAGGTYTWTLPDGFEKTEDNGSAIKVKLSSTASTGTIKVSVTAPNGCKDLTDGSALVNIVRAPETPAIVGPSAVCQKASSITFTIDPPVAGATYTWQLPAGATITSNPVNASSITVQFDSRTGTGTIKVAATVGACADLTPSALDFKIDSLGVANASADVSGYCGASGAMISADIPKIGSGVWTVVPPSTAVVLPVNHPKPLISDLPVGTTVFVWTVTNGACVSKDEVHVYRNIDTPIPDIYTGDRSICGGTINIGAYGVNDTALSILWSFSPNTVTFVPNSDGTISATGFTEDTTWVYYTINGPCSSKTDSVSVSLKSFSFKADIKLDQDTLCLFGKNSANAIALVTDSSGTSIPYTYFWWSSDSSFTRITNKDTVAVVPVNPGWTYYTLRVKDHDNCWSNLEVDSLYGVGHQDLIIPNLITPNHDGKNDCFILNDVNGFSMLPGASFDLYNRWGDRVYRNANYNSGDFCGQNLADGVYYYYLESGCDHMPFKGWLHIISNTETSVTDK